MIDVTELIDITQALDEALKGAYAGEGLNMAQCRVIFGEDRDERWAMLLDIRDRMGGSLPPFAKVTRVATQFLEILLRTDEG